MMDRYGCEPGGMHRLDGGTTCVCGATKSPVIMQRDAFEKMQADLAASQVRIDGMATTIESLRAKDRIAADLILGLTMVVEEMRAYVQQAVEAVEEWDAVEDTESAGVFSIYTMPELLKAGRAILAADPEARAVELMQAREG